MNPARWERLRPVLEALLELPRHQRPRALERLCAGDPRLRREVGRLLDLEQPGPFMEPPHSGDIARLLEHLQQPPAQAPDDPAQDTG